MSEGTETPETETAETAAETYRDFLARRFGGLLLHGGHEPDGEACALESWNVYKGREWTDEPIDLPDLRPLNDACWRSDEARTEALVPVIEALAGWGTWSGDRRQRFARGVELRTIRDSGVLPAALREVGLVREAAACEAARDLQEAREAVRAASTKTKAWAARAAMRGSVARAPMGIAETVRGVRGESILRAACRIWIEEAKASEEEGR